MPLLNKSQYQCKMCCRTFKLVGNLKQHQRIHTGERPYECEICKKTFTLSGNLKVHRRVHTGEKPFECEICMKSFAYISHLNRHRVGHADNKKPYKCEICHKLFSRADYLKEHRRLHTGERPYKCKICSKSYSYRSRLITHEMIHTDHENPLKYEICSESHSSKYLRQHISMHIGKIPHEYGIRRKSLTCTENLKVHKRTHSETYASKSFKKCDSRSCQKEKRIQTEEIPFMYEAANLFPKLEI